MPASIVARVVRMPVLAAVVVPMLVAACSNDPMSPVAPRSQASSVSRSVVPSGDVAAASDISTPWYRNGTQTGKITGDISTPWYRNSPSAPAGTTTSNISTPWYRNAPSAPAGSATSDISTPWY